MSLVEKLPCPVELNVNGKTGRSSSHLVTVLDALHIDLTRFPLRGHSETASNDGKDSLLIIILALQFLFKLVDK